MNNSTRERGLPLGCSPGQPTPVRYDRVSELAGQEHCDEVAARCERDGALP
jgi:hypothetical protein